MLRNLFRNSKNFINKFSTTARNDANVCLIGSSGVIGKPLSLLLKQSNLVTNLKLYDCGGTIAAANELSHIDTPTVVTGYAAWDSLSKVLEKTDIVIIALSIERKPGMSKNDVFTANATVVKEIAIQCAHENPCAIVEVVTGPINSIVPLVHEVYKSEGVTTATNKILGVTHLDVIRARSIIGSTISCDPSKIKIPVVGGNSGPTMIPLLSRSVPALDHLCETERLNLIERIKGTYAESGGGGPTISTAYAAAEFTNAMIRAINGGKDIIECAFAASSGDMAYMAVQVLLGKNGIEKNLGIGKISKDEEAMVKAITDDLKKDIEKGEVFAKSAKDDKCKK